MIEENYSFVMLNDGTKMSYDEYNVWVSASMIEFFLPLDLVTPNKKEHWTRLSKRNHQNDWKLVIHWANNKCSMQLPCMVTITRIGPRKWDGDNLVYACKGIRDSIANLLRPGFERGMADGTELIEWRYDQEKGKIKGARIKIESVNNVPKDFTLLGRNG